MRKSTVVKLDGRDREYKINELTVEEIIQIVNESVLYSKSLDQSDGVGEQTQPDNQKAQAEPGASGEETQSQESLLENLVALSTGVSKDMQEIMAKSCDFTVADLKPLAPSEIREIWDAFKEVNEDFLGMLKALGLMEVIREVREATLSSFSRMLVTLSRAAM